MEKDVLMDFRIILFLLMTLDLQSQISLTEKDEIILPLPLPYNGKVLTYEEVEVFIDKSIDEDKQPILVFGANWCPDCRIFSGTIEIPKLKNYIDEHFNLLYIDVMRYEINMGIMEKYGVPAEEGVPRVLVFDSNKNLLNSSTTAEWRTARERNPQDIFNFFQTIERLISSSLNRRIL